MIIDVDNGYCFNGAIIHLWDLHDGNSALFDLYYWQSKTAYVSTSSLPLTLRNLPLTNAKALTSIPKGAKIEVLCGATDFSGFYRVKYGNQVGFASKQYISFNTVPPTTATYTGYVNTSSGNLILRSGPSTSYSKIASMPKGSQLTVLDNKTITNGFYHIKYNGITGYASASYITFSKPNDNSIVSTNEINTIASKYGISNNSNAYKALTSINDYKNCINRNSTNVFLFEGVGNTASTSARRNAMCVVVKNGYIVYLTLNAGTLPDYPFSPSKNGGDPMPTIKDGVYNYTTKNHKSSYAAINISNAIVVRFKNSSNFYSSTSSAINAHCR